MCAILYKKYVITLMLQLSNNNRETFAKHVNVKPFHHCKNLRY